MREQVQCTMQNPRYRQHVGGSSDDTEFTCSESNLCTKVVEVGPSTIRVFIKQRSKVVGTRKDEALNDRTWVYYTECATLTIIIKSS